MEKIVQICRRFIVGKDVDATLLSDALSDLVCHRRKVGILGYGARLFCLYDRSIRSDADESPIQHQSNRDPDRERRIVEGFAILFFLSGENLSEGVEVVAGEVRKEDRGDAGDTTNPFMPKLFRGGQKKSL